MIKLGEKTTLLIALIIVFVFGYLFYGRIKNALFPNKVDTVEDKVEYKETQVVLGGEGLSHIPKDLPIEEGAIIFKNESQSIAGGFQKFEIRGYYSKKSLDELYNDYKKYFNDHSFTLRSEIKDEKDTKYIEVLFPGSYNEALSVNASKKSITGDVEVKITWIESVLRSSKTVE